MRSFKEMSPKLRGMEIKCYDLQHVSLSNNNPRHEHDPKTIKGVCSRPVPILTKVRCVRTKNKWGDTIFWKGKYCMFIRGKRIAIGGHYGVPDLNRAQLQFGGQS
jgi:hypothetical protein